MVANEIGQVDVFVDGDRSGTRWMTSTAGGLQTAAAAASRAAGTTASARTTAAPPDGIRDKSDGWAVLCDNGLSETDESGPSPSSLLDYYTSVCRYVDEDVLSDDECEPRDQDDDSSPSDGPQETVRPSPDLPAQQDAPGRPDDDMPQNHHQPSVECCDESLVPASGQHHGGVALKSALRRTTTGSSATSSRSLLRKKLRVKFNEALNTFLECDYVIYVDDDEYDLLYHLAAAEQAAQQQQQQLLHHHLQQQQQQQDGQPQLVNVRSFELQLPETSSSIYPSTGQVEHSAVTTTSAAAPPGTDAGTLSPPDGYKDAAALYAAALVVQLDRGKCLDMSGAFLLTGRRKCRGAQLSHGHL